MKKTAVYLMIFALVLVGCSNVFFGPPEWRGGETLTPDIPEGYGTVQVSLSRGAARTIVPEVDLPALFLEYWFAKDEGSPEQKSPADSVFTLEPGSYTLEVKVFVDPEHTDQAALGTTDEAFTITAGVAAGPVNVTLHPVVSGGGTGELGFSLTYPADADVETFTLTPIADEGEPIDLTEAASVSGPDPLSLSGTKTDIPVGYYLLRVVLKNNAGASTGRTEVVHIYRNLSAEANYIFIEDDFRAFRVTSNADSGLGSLRQAIIYAESMSGGGPQTIQVVLEPGSVIELTTSGLEITKRITLEGNGITLTQAASWTSSDTSQLLRITSTTAEVKISRVHFKDGLTTGYGVAVQNSGILTLESCIFNGNSATSTDVLGNAVFSTNTLTVRGCTFYDNASGNRGRAVYFGVYDRTLTLEGNLFYGNTAPYPVVLVNTGTVSASYNVVDVALGTGSAQAGFSAAGGNTSIGTSCAISGKTFKLLYGSGAAAALPNPLPAGYPTTDFYGNAINGGGAAGAVQASTTNQSGYYYLEHSVNNALAGDVTVNSSPDEDGLYQPGTSIEATANPGTDYTFGYWLVNGVEDSTNPLPLSGHSRIQAVFNREVEVNIFTDGSGSDTTLGTLRHALTNAQDGDIITFSGVTPGTHTIALASTLPGITKSITLEGNGITLTRAASWTSSGTSQLLRINSYTAEVKISRVYFKDGLTTGNGVAVQNYGILTLESCIFSGNRNTSSSGGAVYSLNTLTVRGCTFYNNTSGNSGGVVYFSASGKTLTLEGNLFYRNSASSGYPVVYLGLGSGTVSASYNVVDVAQAGWTAGTGNTTIGTDFANLPISGKTFKLLYGSSVVIKVLPNPLPADYPDKDFYGDSISGGGAAGAVQASTTNQSGYYLEHSVNNALAGTLTVSPTPDPDEDGLYPSGTSITATTTVGGGYSFTYWLVNGVEVEASTNPLPLSSHSRIQAVFNREVEVNIFTDGSGSDTTPGTLRYALTNAQDGDVITFSGVTPGTTEIALASALPQITKHITLKGNGITLTRAASWTSNLSQLLRINSYTAEVKISRVYFKDGRAEYNGAAVFNGGILTLESCIFSGNSTIENGAYGGAVYSGNTLTVRGCTFYDNNAYFGGAVYFSASGKTLTLEGNLFYGNSASSNPVVYLGSGTVSASYNVVDVALTRAGWTAGTGDTTIGTDFAYLPISYKTFRLLYGSSAADKLPDTLPAGYPDEDFYGDSISGGGAAGAVQDSTAIGYYYLEYSQNNALAGTVTVNPLLNEDGLYQSGASIEATANPGTDYTFGYWLVNGVEDSTNPLPLSAGHSRIQAVFNRAVTVNTFTDGSGSDTTLGTLRYALTDAQDGDVITFSGVMPGTTEIALTSALPQITKRITLEGNGITLTRAASWTSSDTSQLLYINSYTAEVKISRVHFKDGLAEYGAAIQNSGILTLESCIFSGNSTTSSCGAVYSYNTLTVRGCTFYNNTSASWGGAVYFGVYDRTLTLEGNLFYGNTAPVVYMLSGTVSASYNVVDVALGWSNTQAGFSAATGNKTTLDDSDDLTILVDPFDTTTFVPVAGLQSPGVLPSPKPTDFPDTDFYGTTRTFPSAPGAVATTPPGGP